MPSTAFQDAYTKNFLPFWARHKMRKFTILWHWRSYQRIIYSDAKKSREPNSAFCYGRSHFFQENYANTGNTLNVGIWITIKTFNFFFGAKDKDLMLHLWGRWTSLRLKLSANPWIKVEIVDIFWIWKTKSKIILKSLEKCFFFIHAHFLKAIEFSLCLDHWI